MPLLSNREDRATRVAEAMRRLFRVRGAAVSVSPTNAERLEKELASAFYDAAIATANEIGFTIDKELVAQQARNYVNLYTSQLGSMLLRKLLRTDIDDLGDDDIWKTAAATELIRAATAGMEFAKAMHDQTGETSRTFWRTESSACAICGPLGGMEREEWAVLFPLGPPSPHPNCACHLEYVRVAEPATVRGLRPAAYGGVIPQFKGGTIPQA